MDIDYLSLEQQLTPSKRDLRSEMDFVPPFDLGCVFSQT